MTAAKQYIFHNDTAAICIFVKGLQAAPAITAKIYEKDLQTLAEVIRLIEKLNVAHQLRATLTPSSVSMMSGNDRCFVFGCTCYFGHHCPDVHCYGCDELATLNRTAQTRFLPQEHHATKTDLIQGIDTHTAEGTDNTPIMTSDIEDISPGHSPAAIPTITKVAVLEGTPHAPLPANAGICTTFQLINAPITTYTVTPSDIVEPHPTFTTSPTDIILATLQTTASLAPATPITQHMNLSPEKPNNAQDPQP